MQFARLNGVTLHHQVIGASPDKPTIIFVNSLGTDFRIWRDVIVRLVGEYGLITYDKRGHYEMIEKVGLYWHFVDLVWVFVFTFFYLV